MSASELETAALSPDRLACVNHWSRLVAGLRESSDQASQVPGAFPIWGFELDPWQHYPSHENPRDWILDLDALTVWREAYMRTLENEPWFSEDNAPTSRRADLRKRRLDLAETTEWIATWPAYARSRDEWPGWKRRFIEQNRNWALRLWRSLDPKWLRHWLDDLSAMRPSYQKLEWNCKGSEAKLEAHVLQFRPSGLRVKCFAHVPALVAMTATQVPVVQHIGERGPGSPRLRHLFTHEALELQGFPADWALPKPRDMAFRALGNAVHTEIVAAIAKSWLQSGDLMPASQGLRRVSPAEGSV